MTTAHGGEWLNDGNCQKHWRAILHRLASDLRTQHQQGKCQIWRMPGQVPADQPCMQVIVSGGSPCVVAVQVQGLAAHVQFGQDCFRPTTDLTEVRGGPMHYVAPECIFSDYRANAAADVFWVGALGYELLTGHRYRSVTSEEALLRAIHSESDPEKRRKMPPWLHPLIARMLDGDPGKRPSMDEVVGELQPTPPPGVQTVGEAAANAEKEAEQRAGRAVKGAQVLMLTGRSAHQYQTIGQGGAATVVSYHNPEKSIHWAIKVFHNEAYYKIEKEALEKLAGVPGILPVIWQGTAGQASAQRCCMVTDLIDAAPITRENVLDRIQAAIQAAKTLSICHKRGVIHADLNPQHVLIHRADHKVRIIDFSAAWPNQAKRRFLPPPGWYAPELLKPQDTPTEKVDVFALGKVLQSWFGKGFDHFPPLIQNMIAPDPNSRPTMAQVHRSLKDLRSRGWLRISLLGSAVIGDIASGFSTFGVIFITATAREIAESRGRSRVLQAIQDLMPKERIP